MGRCPIECRLRQDSRKSWHYQVLVRRETDEDIRFGDVIYDTKEPEDHMRRAQHAVLNPLGSSRKLSSSISERDDNLTFRPPLAFSNVVCVAMWGPKVPDLTFIDVPGASIASPDWSP
jgi:hypothetical protein